MRGIEVYLRRKYFVGDRDRIIKSYQLWSGIKDLEETILEVEKEFHRFALFVKWLSQNNWETPKVGAPLVILTGHARRRLNERGIDNPNGLYLTRLSKEEQKKLPKYEEHNKRIDKVFWYAKTDENIYIMELLKGGIYTLITAFKNEL
jgi:hypothetical protein